MSVSRDELRRLVDALPEEETRAVKRFLEFVLSRAKAEGEAWLEADLGEVPPYDWGPGGPPAGKPVRYEPGVGLVVEGGKP